jgi:class 3 adenylate cyclase/tetratricopeptide (TPR) repeat protein
MLVCSRCGAENRPGRKFCAQCAAGLAISCPACGGANQPGEKFCGECGAALADAPQPGSGAASVIPAAERRLVSVLFADLVGFTSLSDSRDPEEVREVLTRYFDTARKVIARYGGSVDKFIGDAVVAVWGTPASHEDDAERAVRAALDLIDGVAALASGDGLPPLALRAAIGTGPAAVLVGATGQGMVAGDLVNTASRLQAAAAPGTVVVDEATYRIAGRAVAFEMVGNQTLKGKAQTVPAWRALRVVAGRRGLLRAEGLEPPFVGRDTELRLLKELFHATQAEHRARLLSVVGQAGIGKSRLAWEFQKYIDGLVGDVYWHQGRSPAYGDGITFWALGEMLRQRCGIAETDDGQVSRDRLAATLAKFVTDDAERAWLTPALSALLGLEAAPAGAREELFAAWRTFFERISDRGPTVMVFEDVQWADQGQLDFIEYLLEWSRAHPILIITLARQELLERRPTWGAGQRNFTALHLEPLSKEVMGNLLRGLASGLPTSVAGQILARAEGIPLYAVEIVRMLLDDGRLTKEDGSYRLTGDLSRLEVPATLHALVAARIDSLSTDERSVIQHASVLGQSFVVEGLLALTSLGRDQLDPTLRSLVRKELVALDSDPRSPERGQYQFVQGLLREVAHETLSKRERRERHLAVAHYLEGLGDAELLGVVASHYLDAHRATPAGSEAELLATQARHALRVAAERAAALHSHEQAFGYLEQALMVTRDESERAFLLERAAGSAVAIGRDVVAEDYLSKAMAHYQEVGDPDGRARTATALANFLTTNGHSERAIRLLESVRVPELDPSPAFVALNAELARAFMIHLDGELAVQCADRALMAADKPDLVPVMVEALITRGCALAQPGGNRFREAQAVLAGALWLAEGQGLVLSEIRARINLGVFLSLDEPRLAFDIIRRGYDLARRLGHRSLARRLAGEVAWYSFRLGDWDLGLAVLNEQDRDYEEGFAAILDRLILAIYRASRGDRPGAERLVDGVDALLSGSTNPEWAEGLTTIRVFVAAATGQMNTAYETAIRFAPTMRNATHRGQTLGEAGHAALALRDSQRARRVVLELEAMGNHGKWLEASTQSHRAGLALLEGRTDEGLAAYRSALAAWRDLGVVRDLGLCLLNLASLAGIDHPDGRAAADEAREIFTRLKATSALERLEALSGQLAVAR